MGRIHRGVSAIVSFARGTSKALDVGKRRFVVIEVEAALPRAGEQDKLEGGTTFGAPKSKRC